MNKEQDHGYMCSCYVCRYGKEQVDIWEKGALKKYGWFAHRVIDHDPQSPTGFNMHTHGIPENFDHPDFQIVVPGPDQMWMTFFHLLVDDYIKKGVKFEPGIDYPDIADDGYMVRFMEATECGRPVLRMLIPNANGKFESGVFELQLQIVDTTT